MDSMQKKARKPVMGKATPHQVEPDLVTALRDHCPNGPWEFIPIMLGQMELCSQKNQAYAGGGNALGNFYRVAQILSLYPGFPYNTPEGVAFTYALKQLDCEAHSMSQNLEDEVEGYKGRTDDQAVYANLRRCIREVRESMSSGVGVVEPYK